MSLEVDNISQFLKPDAQCLLQAFKGTYYDWCAKQAGVPREPTGPSHPDDFAPKSERFFSDMFPKNPTTPREFDLISVMLE